MTSPIHSRVRRVERIRHELRRRDVEVAHVERLSPGFAAVTFRGPALDGFLSLSFDDHVKFMFHDAAGELVRRDYTPRRFDAERRELTIEFALHGEGAASDWARQATVGQPAIIGGPRGSMVIPTDYDWHLLAGDDTALPAIHRRLEELPSSTQAIVIAHVAAPDRRLLATRPGIQLQWVDSDEALVAAVSALPLPPGEGFAWCAGEASTMARMRQVLLAEKDHPREAARIAAYWKRGASEFHENLE
jgi:NADPH-dependent ferric siderophore reductase